MAIWCGLKKRVTMVVAFHLMKRRQKNKQKCHIVPKIVKRGPLVFISIQSVANYLKTRRGTLLGHEIFSEKSHSAKKIRRGTL